MEHGEHRFGFVAVAGRPNAGKSTLVNRIMKTEVAIVTPKAQTTRNRISAIYTTPEFQMVLQDTPGLHEAKGRLNRSLMDTAVKTVQDADLVLLLVEPRQEISEHDLQAIEVIKAAGLPCVLAINKIDTIHPQVLLPLIEAYAKIHAFEHIVPISATEGSGIDELVDILVGMLPPGPPQFPDEDISDLPVRFFVAEMVREQIMRLTGEEIPYKTAVVVEEFKEEPRRVLIRADIHVEKDSQKKILIGKSGSMIKKIGIAAREKIEQFIEQPVRLELFVKVTPHWTRSTTQLREFGYETRG
jgi:GTP-binding protein Era